MVERQAEVADLLHSAAIHLLRRAREADVETGLSPAGLSALSVLVFRGPLTLGALADAEGVRSSTMTGIVKGLEERGLVRRRPHESDRRAILLEASQLGRRLLMKGRRRRIELIVERLQGLSQRDLTVLWNAANLLEDRFALPGLRWQPVDSDAR